MTDNPINSVRRLGGADIISVTYRHQGAHVEDWFLCLHGNGKTYSIPIEAKVAKEAIEKVGLPTRKR